MQFEWDENKNRRNLAKHNVRFETAALVFDDLHALTQRDELSDDEERWKTLGILDSGVVLVVIHTWVVRSEEEVARIISARVAESRERKIYEEAYQGAKTRYRRSGSHERRRR